MTFDQAKSRLRAAAHALQAQNYDLKPRLFPTLTLTFGPHERVAIMWIVALDRDPGEFAIHALVDASANRDRPGPVKVFNDVSSHDEIANWTFTELCQQA
jgi:hypothetical protein